MQNLEIVGVPMNRDENVITLATNIASVLGVELVPAEIDAIHRVPRPQAVGSNVQQKPKNIIIRFASRMKRNEFISAAKKKRGLNARDIGFGSDARIFINEHLSKYYKDLFYKAKAKCTENNFKYIWIKDCKIYARKTDAGRVVHISTEADLNRLV
ncbi:l1 transposable element-related [Holotrichia oblita]|uniref:L1 transposable element-related n=1 Tax=Holotrichia oblita TaxID=644536 RepID=A0ACB9T698_HOLOL|nr:l1 transposable element-related [Holotrichia oblita]